MFFGFCGWDSVVLAASAGLCQPRGARIQVAALGLRLRPVLRRKYASSLGLHRTAVPSFFEERQAPRSRRRAEILLRPSAKQKQTEFLELQRSQGQPYVLKSFCTSKDTTSSSTTCRCWFHIGKSFSMVRPVCRTPVESLQDP